MKTAMNLTSPVQPAMDALVIIKDAIKSHIGKEGGNLQGRLLANCAVVDATLRQLEPLRNMVQVVNQQAEVAVHAFRQLALMPPPAPASNGTDNGDDGTSDTKGE